MISPFADWLRAYTRQLRAARVDIRRTVRQIAKVVPDGHWLRYVHLVGGERWGTLATQSRRDLKAADRGVDRLRGAQRRFAPLVQKLPQVKTAATFAPNPNDLPEFDAMLRSVRAALRQDGHTPAELNRASKFFREFKSDGVGEVLTLNVNRLAGVLDVLSERYQAVAMGATVAIAVGRFNQAVAAPPTLRDTPEAYLKLARADLDATELALHDALTGGDPFSAWGRAVELRRMCARRLLAGAIPHAAVLAVGRAAAPEDAALGSLAIDYGTLIRRMLAGVAVGQAIEWASGWGVEGAAFQRWAEAAAETKPGSGYRWPRTSSIRSLARSSARADGTDRTLVGRITEVTIRHQGRKAISNAVISDGTDSVTIALAHIKVDSGGIVPGAAVRLAGTWRASSKEARKAPALELDRRALAVLGKTNWSERMLREAQAIYTPVPHGLAAEWSWEPGVDGAGNQLRYATWFLGKDE